MQQTASFGAPAASSNADLVALLHQSINNLNSKFDKFNETVTGKITSIEKNYEDLNKKIEVLAIRRKWQIEDKSEERQKLSRSTPQNHQFLDKQTFKVVALNNSVVSWTFNPLETIFLFRLWLNLEFLLWPWDKLISF